MLKIHIETWPRNYFFIKHRWGNVSFSWAACEKLSHRNKMKFEALLSEDTFESLSVTILGAQLFLVILLIFCTSINSSINFDKIRQILFRKSDSRKKEDYVFKWFYIQSEAFINLNLKLLSIYFKFFIPNNQL